MLGAVVQHERELLSQLDDARAEARTVIDEAHLDAGRLEDEAQKSLSVEVAELQRAAEAAREQERQTLLAQAREKVEADRSQARSYMEAAVRDVVALVVPGRKAEG